MKKNKIITKDFASQKSLNNRENLLKLFKNSPIPENELLPNLGLFMNSQLLKKILFLNEIYKQIKDINGIIIEFGVRWGQNLALLSILRDIYEPYNRHRKIVGFDTFEGFPSVNPLDGSDEIVTSGAYSVTPDYESYLENVLNYNDKEAAISHLKKFELVKGDASVELKKYLDKHPETIISFAFFDFDIYEPTKNCLTLIQNYLTKGSIIGFDELNLPEFPGETIALKEVLGLKRYKIHRNIYCNAQSYIIID